jgi:glycosyltransferase involved in cell wall biosynthesis
MRIAYLAWHGSVHTRRWVSWFAARGHEVHVVTCGDAAAHDLAADGTAIPHAYRVHDLGPVRFGKLGYFLKLRRARAVVRGLEPDVVHAHFLTSYGLLALAAGARPLVATGHGDDLLISPRQSRFLRWVVRRVLRAAVLVTVPSEAMADAARELLADAEHRPEVDVFQYGVEALRLATVGREVRGAADGDPSRPLRVVSARALLGLYRIDALLDAAALLERDGVDFELHLLGDGPQRAQLERRALDLGFAPGLVTFHGAVPADEVERQVAGSDLYVSVSESDGVSLALLEALALGAVPVLSDIPANRDWVADGATGVLVPIEAAGIADGIRRAARLDRTAVREANLALVASRADRDTNLTACEERIDELCGVRFDRAGEAGRARRRGPGRKAA